MTSIQEMMYEGKQCDDKINGFFRTNGVRKILNGISGYKSKGVPAAQVMLYLVGLVFTKKSMYMNMRNKTNDPGFGKDVVYRFLNSAYINWSMYLLKLAMKVIAPIKVSTSEQRMCALVVDDTMFERGRSKLVELLANVHDHASKGRSKFKRGFRLLTLGWTDGATFIPLLYRHMSSKDAKNRYTEIDPRVDKRSSGYKARQQAISGAPQVLLWMLEQAKKAGVPAKHVLFDSWFSFPSTMMSMHKIGFHGVGMLKNTKTIKYMEGNAKKTLTEIYAAHRKRPGKSRYLLSVEVLLYNDKDETVPARIVFVRDRNNRKKWLAIGTTDMELQEEAIIGLYGKRWDIEVFFKMCKSYLNLGKEFQGVSYDLITAHTAIVMTRYIILASDKRHNEDPRTITEMFHSCYDEVADVTFARALSLLLDALHTALLERLSLAEYELNVIIDSFINGIAKNFKLFYVMINS